MRGASDMDDKQFETLMEKIDVLGRLLALNALSGRKTLADRVVALSTVGFRPKDIGWLLGKDPQRINEMLYKHRKSGAKSENRTEATRDG